MAEADPDLAILSGESRIEIPALPILVPDPDRIGFSFPRRSTTFPAAMDSKQLALLCRELADNRKAENIVVLDLRKLAGVTDFMVICSGTSEPHLRAVEEEIADRLRDDHGLRPRAVDGTRHSGWIVLDFVDVLVHVMKPDIRERYDLEGLWNDATRLRATRKQASAKKARARVARPEGTAAG